MLEWTEPAGLESLGYVSTHYSHHHPLNLALLISADPTITLALPGMIMVEAQFFVFEVLTLASSQFGSSYLAAQSVVVALTSMTFNISFPLSIAASTRVANLIGAGLSDAARTNAQVMGTACYLLHASAWLTLYTSPHQLHRRSI